MAVCLDLRRLVDIMAMIVSWVLCEHLFSFLFSLIQFFQKMKKWLDMTNSEDDFRKKIDRLNRNFAVVSVIFKKFDNIFFKIFKSRDALDSMKTHRSRKQRYNIVFLCLSSIELNWRRFSIIWSYLHLVYYRGYRLH